MSRQKYEISQVFESKHFIVFFSKDARSRKRHLIKFKHNIRYDFLINNHTNFCEFVVDYFSEFDVKEKTLCGVSQVDYFIAPNNRHEVIDTVKSCETMLALQY